MLLGSKEQTMNKLLTAGMAVLLSAAFLAGSAEASNKGGPGSFNHGSSNSMVKSKTVTTKSNYPVTYSPSKTVNNKTTVVDLKKTVTSQTNYTQSSFYKKNHYEHWNRWFRHGWGYGWWGGYWGGCGECSCCWMFGGCGPVAVIEPGSGPDDDDDGPPPPM
jgi:hypothetical protein